MQGCESEGTAASSPAQELQARAERRRPRILVGATASVAAVKVPPDCATGPTSALAATVLRMSCRCRRLEFTRHSASLNPNPKALLPV